MAGALKDLKRAIIVGETSAAIPKSPAESGQGRRRSTSVSPRRAMAASHSWSALTISSTDCRHRVESGEPVWYLVPDGVVQYIGKHRLYRG